MNKELEESLNLIAQVCGAFVGNLQQHSNIQKALQTIKESLEENDE